MKVGCARAPVPRRRGKRCATTCPRAPALDRAHRIAQQWPLDDVDRPSDAVLAEAPIRSAVGWSWEDEVKLWTTVGAGLAAGMLCGPVVGQEGHTQGHDMGGVAMAPAALPAVCPAVGDPGASAMPMPSMDGASEAQRGLMQATMALQDAMMTGMTANDPDVAFACAMIPHHQSAIEMAKVELSDGKAGPMRAMAQAIIDAQQREIAELTQWLEQQSN
jgi:hypothetical protein